MHDQWDIVTRSIQPVLWLLLFGGVFGRLRVLPAGFGSYLDFVAPGILAQSVLTIAIFQGITVIWERDQGTLQKYLVSPMPRSALALGKGLGSGVRGMVQALTIAILALLMGVHLVVNPLAWLGTSCSCCWAPFAFPPSLCDRRPGPHPRARARSRADYIDAALLRLQRPVPGGDNAALRGSNRGLQPLSYMVDGLRS